jgi:hypothetical protein
VVCALTGTELMQYCSSLCDAGENGFLLGGVVPAKICEVLPVIRLWMEIPAKLARILERQQLLAGVRTPCLSQLHSV